MSKTIKRLLIGSAILAPILVLLLFVTARSFARKFQPEVRRQAIQYLEQRFNSRVTLEDLEIHLPNVSPVGLLMREGRGTVARVEGRNLSLRLNGSAGDLPPVLTIASFHFDLDLGALRQAQPHVAHVAVNGMRIFVPPKGQRAPHQENSKPGPGSNAIVDRVDISDARMVILPNRKDRKPLDFELQNIHLDSAGLAQSMKYQATLTNPRPPGQIITQGTFGPWNRDDPGNTPLDGDYDFSNADLGVFKAIAGILHSSGHFTGTLSAVRARGEATVPDFRLKSSGNKVNLKAQYDVLVDGTNGNTTLQPVQARLLNTDFQTSGGIVKHELGGRRAIDLDVVMPSGHIEDLLLLAMKGKPFMSGVISMKSKISIPPLGGSVKEKLFLAGTFDVANGEFLKDVVQDKVDELSRRGQGRPSDAGVDNVFSRMRGTFRLEDQVMSFKRLDFAVPGADVGIHGQYRMADDVLDFHGDLKLDAKVSQTLKGWKRWLAKPLDPFFAKNGAGTFLRIQVVGSARKPEFGRDHGGQ
jgi:hypothetical protein